MRVSKLTRILSLLLVFVMGFLTCVISIVGVGYYAASQVSIDKLKGWGVDIDVDKYIAPDAEVSLTAMTLLGLINEVDILSKIEGELTVERLLDRYGLALTDDAEGMLPSGLMSLDIRDVFTEEGIDHILKNTNVDYLFKFLPEDVLSAPARDALSNKTFKNAMDEGLTYLLEDVRLGYLTGVTYELDEKNEYKVIFKDANAPTMMELIAPLSIADLLEAVTSNGDILAVVANDIGDVMLESLLGSFADLDSMPGLFEGTLLADVLKKDDETGNYLFDITAAFSGKTFGDLLGFEPVYLNSSPTLSVNDPAPSVIIGWKDADGKSVTGIMRGLASASLDCLFGDEGMDIDSMLSDAYFGDVMGYVPIEFDENGVPTKWETENGDEPDAILSTAINKSLGDMMGGDFEVNTLFEGKYVGDAMGYYKSTADGKWYEDSAFEVELVGINSIVAEIDIGELMGGDGYDVSVVFEGKLGGDLFGYKKELVNGEVVWFDGDVEVTGTDRAVANLEIGKLIDTEAEYDIADAFSDLYLGELIGYIKATDEHIASTSNPDFKVGDWIQNTGTEDSPVYESIGALEVKLADYNVGEIMKGEADLDADTIIDGLTLADIMGFEERDDGWYDKGNKVTGIMSILAKTEIPEINTKLSGMPLGEVMGYHLSNPEDPKSGWLDEQNNPVTGIMDAFADLTVNDMSDSSKVTAKVQEIKIADALGYYYNDNTKKWYTTADTENQNDGTEVTGIMATIANTEVGGLNGKIQDLTIWEALGYKEITDESGNVIGYFDPAEKKNVDGMMAAIAGFKVNELNKEIPELQFKDIFGEEQSGVLSYFADMKINDMRNSSKVSETVKKITVGDAMGYVKVEVGNDVEWYKVEDGALTEVEGVLGAIAGSPVGELQDAVDNITLNALFEGKVGEDADGFLKLLKPDTTLSELNGNGENSLTNTFKNATMQQFIDAKLLTTLTSSEIGILNTIDVSYAKQVQGLTVKIDINNHTYVDADGNGVRGDNEVYYGLDDAHTGGWRHQTLEKFIPYVISGIQYLPPSIS